MRPESFDDEFRDEWSEWVLDHGLVSFPEALRRGESVPIARWVGSRFGAVFHVQWPAEDEPTWSLLRASGFRIHTESFRRIEPNEDDPSGATDDPAGSGLGADDDEDDETEQFMYQVDLFERIGDRWEWIGGSGGDWFDPPLQRPKMKRRFVETWGVGCSYKEGTPHCANVEGLVGPAAAFIEVHDPDGVTRTPIESPLGALVACAHAVGPAEFRILDKRGRAIYTESFNTGRDD